MAAIPKVSAVVARHGRPVRGHGRSGRMALLSGYTHLKDMCFRQMIRFKTLYVMRHGETEDNVSNTITAQSDSPLTMLGCEQAKGKGLTLRAFGNDLRSFIFISSPLHRACATMELARVAAGLPPQPYATDHRLMEMDFGDWTKRQEGDDKEAPGLPTAHEQWDFRPPGGESQRMVHARVGRFLESLTSDCVIVCHARVLCMIRGHLLELSPEQTMHCEPPNAGLLRLQHGNETWFGL
jgi:broad specificity phosphatase PhoE